MPATRSSGPLASQKPQSGSSRSDPQAAAPITKGAVGLGYMVLEAQQTFRTERVFAGIFVIGLIGFTTDLGFRHLRRMLIPWYRETEG
jgi:ABC-type nitrate/sulfonate/bicarbonate transport system permease component